MATVDNSVLTSLSSLNALAGKISPQSTESTTRNNNNCITITANGTTERDRVMNNREPDPDTIKMFVGQVPRAMDEADLRKMFEEFGEVYQINVLRDKVTGQSKGCCFVTFYSRKSALEAQNALHNIKTLDGMHHPIQMKPADTENRNERKLFVGMLTKRYNEDDVKSMFSQFGNIEECTVLRDNNGQSKGCAFVTFSSKQCAINAIKKMHHVFTMDGCSSPLVVKFADTQKEKDAKRIQSNLWGVPTAGNLTAIPSQYLTFLQQHIGNSNPTPTAQTVGGMGSLTHLPSLNNLSVQQLLAASQNNLSSQQLFDSSGLGSLNSLGSLSHASSPSNTQETTLQNILASLNSQSQGLGVNLATLAAMSTANSANSLQALSQPSFGTSISPTLANISTVTTTGKQVEGPDGANLFIYHLPQDFTDNELALCFYPYGKVLSAKVFIDKQTNLSKCFGFVSYENAQDAQRAIQQMNGRTVGNKRLKVQLKRSKNDPKPY